MSCGQAYLVQEEFKWR